MLVPQASRMEVCMSRSLRSMLAGCSVLCCLVACGLPSSKAPSTFQALPKQEVADGVWLVGEKFEVYPKPANAFDSATGLPYVPLDVGTSYSWWLKLETRKANVTWREEFTLPSAPDQWGAGEPMTLKDDRRVAVTSQTVTPDNGWIHHGWSVAAGDPPGKYVMKIYINSQPAHEFAFFVGEAEESN